MSGFVHIHRRLLGHTSFRNDGEAMAFAWLILRASWRATTVRYKDREIRLERGQLAMSVRDMAAHLERSKDWAQRFLNRCTNRDMIATDTATGVNIITIRNYDEYQPKPGDARQTLRQQPRQERDRAATQNKEGNKGKEEEAPNGALGAQSRGTRLPDDFDMPQEWKGWARLRGILPTLIDEEAESFTRYWQAEAGAKARKVNWEKTWQNWIVRAARQGRHHGKRTGSGWDHI